MNLVRICSLIGVAVLAAPAAAQQAAPRTDAFGDPLPPAALARMGTVRLRHGAPVESVQFVADGKWLMSGGHDDTVRLWDPQTGREVYRFRGRAGRVSPDGKTLVTWGERCAVFDLATGKELPWSAEKMPGLTYNAAAAFTPDGKGLVTGLVRTVDESKTGKLKIGTIDLATGKVGATWFGPVWDGRNNLHVSPGGDIIGASHGSGWDPANRIDLHDAATGKVVATCPYFSRITFSADGSRFVTEAPQPDNVNPRILLLVIDAKTGKERYRYPTGQETNAALSPDGSKVAFMNRHAGGKALVRVADVATGKLLHELPCPSAGHGSLRFSSNGAWLVAAQDNGIIQVWDVARGKVVREINSHMGGTYWTADVSPDGKLVAAVDDNLPLVQVWSLATGKLLPDLYAIQHGPDALAFSRDGKKLATVSSHGAASVWDAASGRLTERLPLGLDEDGYFPFDRPRLYWADDGHVHLLGLTHNYWPRGEGKKPEGTIHLVDLSTGKPLRAFEKTGFRMHWWTVSADRRTVAAAVGDEIALWDLETGQARGTLPLSESGAEPRKPNEDSAYPIGLAFAPNGKALAIYDRRFAAAGLWRFGPVTIRELASGKIRSKPWQEDQRNQLIEFLDHDNGYAQVCFTPDGKNLLLVTRTSVMLWDPAEGREIRRYGAHELYQSTLTFSPDGKLLAGIQYGYGLSLWDVATGTILHNVRNGASEVTAFAFSPDGKALATAFSDTTVFVWDVKELLTAAVPEPLPAKALEALWKDLASGDTVAAGKAVTALQKGGAAAAAFLKGRVQAVPAPDPKFVERLLGDLESGKFAAREQAVKDLEQLGDQVLPTLRKVLQGKPPLETKQRVLKLVERMEGPTADPKVLQLMRAVEVLEDIGGPDAQATLEAVAKGMPGHRVTEAAQDALRKKGP
jgi:WD40 repeat protein